MSNTAAVITILTGFIAVQGIIFASYRHSLDIVVGQLSKRIDHLADGLREVRDEVRDLRRDVHAIGATVAEHEGRLKGS